VATVYASSLVPPASQFPASQPPATPVPALEGARGGARLLVVGRLAVHQTVQTEIGYI